MAQKFGNLGSYVPGEDEIIKTADLMTFGKSFARSNGQPLDESEVWYDLEALEAYALTNSAYVGQKVVYIDLENAKVYQYSIELDGTLKEIGTAPVGDGKSIVVDENGVISLKGVSTADALTLPQKQSDGTIAWVPISAIVEGDGNTVTEVAAKDNTLSVESTQTTDGDGAVTGISYSVAVKVSEEEGNAVVVNEDGLYVATPEAYDDTDIKASIKANADAIDAVDARVNTTDGNVTAIDGRLKTAEGEIDTLQSQMTQAQSDINTVEEKAAANETAIGEVRTTANAAKAKAEVNEASIGTINSTLATKANADEVYTATEGEALAGRVTAVEGRATTLEEKVTALEGTTHFAGAGLLSARPETANDDGDIYVATDNGKEYIWVTDKWVELGDVTAEQERLSKVEADISTINTNLGKKADATQVTTDIGTAKQEAIDAAAEDATTKANAAEKSAKDYADAELKKLSETHEADKATLNTAIETAVTNAATDATTKANAAQAAAEATAASNLATARTEISAEIKAVDDKFANYKTATQIDEADEALNAKITANTNKFADYYTKTEVDTTVSGINTEIGKKADQTALDAVEGKVDALAQIKSVEESEFNITEAGKLEVKEVAQAKVTGLTTALAGKVDKVDGYGLLADSDKAKLDKLTLSGDDLTISGSVEAGSVNNLDTWITGNRDSLAGLFSTSNQTKLEGIADGAQVNVIEQVNLAGTKLEVNNKVVNINYGTADLAGIVKSATDMNTVAIGSDGVMTVNNISVEKLTVPDGVTFILNGGNA